MAVISIFKYIVLPSADQHKYWNPETRQRSFPVPVNALQNPLRSLASPARGR